ncbi:MAG: hypothetical protein JST82_12980 [Bacteroidetes bacterium]|nr:hypothetical protein [Bacteroidota bacterium]
MKYTILCMMSIAALNLTSCKETDGLKNDATNEKMRDTLNKLYPSLLEGQVGVEVHDFHDVNILLGDKQLFEKTEEEKAAIVKTISELTYQMYNDNNYLEKGKITFVEVENRMPNDSDPKKEYDMHLQDIIKSHEKK